MGELRLEEVQLIAQVRIAGQYQVQVVHEGLSHSRGLFILHPRQTQDCVFVAPCLSSLGHAHCELS